MTEMSDVCVFDLVSSKLLMFGQFCPKFMV